MGKIQRALISVSDKTGIVEFAKVLANAGVEIVSTGGTARALQDANISVVSLDVFTGFPEILDGRVKTLHPRVHGGLLYRREDADHLKAVEDHNLEPIDLVVVNLYPFEATVAKPDCSFEMAIENIDIGGPSMLRSAAKNFESVTVITSSEDYDEAARQITECGETTLEFRRQLAARVFERTAAYDGAIAQYFASQGVSSSGARASSNETLEMGPSRELRYGENPHQSARLCGAFDDQFEQLHGKALSYNNILDLTAAADLIGEFRKAAPTVAILKHMNPCGVGQGSSLAEGWKRAYAADQQAPFGGIIAVNTELDADCATAISEIFCEAVLAPAFSEDALKILKAKKNLRLIRQGVLGGGSGEQRVRGVGFGSYLIQDEDPLIEESGDWKVATDREPTEDEWRAMRFGWRVVKHVKSNAIVYCDADGALGIGAGQMSRVDSSRIAVWKAEQAGLDLAGSVICSDAFFPFPDGLIAAAEAGATAAIQPGGSVRDAEVVAAANERGVAMVFTGRRHFRH